MAVLQAYCDETGIHDGAKLTAVAGYLLDLDSLRDFNRAWKEALKPFAGRGIDCFHACKCCRVKQGKPFRDRPFDNLTDDEARVLVDELISIIRSTVVCGFAIGIEDSHYALAVHSSPGIEAIVGSKYTICVQGYLDAVSDWAKSRLGPQDRIVYHFESGCPHESEAETLLCRIAKNEDLTEQYRYGGHGFYPKRRYKPLQAADLLAWLWQLAFRQKKLSPEFQALLQQPWAKPHWLGRVTASNLMSIALQNAVLGIAPGWVIPESDSVDGDTE